MRETVARTGTAVRLAVGRRDAGLVVAATTLGYLLLYLVATRTLLPGTGRVGLLVTDRPLELLLRRNGLVSFEPLARVDLGVATLLVSPVELLLAGGVAALVGLNVGLSYLAWRQPAACGISPGTGLLAAVPALLSGSACCAPVLFVVLGLQVSGLALATLEVLLPVSVALLVASLLLVGRRVQPVAAGGA